MRLTGAIVLLLCLGSMAVAEDDAATLTAKALELREAGNLWRAEEMLRQASDLEQTADRLAHLGATRWMIAREMVRRGEGSSPGGGAAIKSVLIDGAQALNSSIAIAETVTARVYLGRVKLYLSDETGALSEMERAVELAPKDPFALSVAAREAFRRGLWPRGLDLCARLIAVQPENAEAHLLLGKCRYFGGLADEAADPIVAALRLDPGLQEGYAYLRGLYLNRGRFVEMEGALGKVLEKHPEHIPTLNNLGVTLVQKGDHARAVGVFEKLMKLDAEDLDATCWVAWLYAFQLDRLSEGLTLFGSILERDRTYAKATDSLDYLARRAMADERLEDAHRALFVWCKADPANDRAQANRGLILRRLGRYEEAAKAYAAGIEANPLSAEITSDFGLVRLAQGRTEDGKALFRAALEIDSEFMNALENLAILARVEGDLPLALQYFRRAYLACRGQNEEREAKYRRYLDLIAWADR
jgi:tetratricopeptide (TPR) repeat protein